MINNSGTQEYVPSFKENQPKSLLIFIMSSLHNVPTACGVATAVPGKKKNIYAETINLADAFS